MTAPRHAPGGFPVVGIIGGGQLARMCAPPAVNLGLTLSVLAEGPDAAAALVTPSAPVGSYLDVDDVVRFARDCDVVTFDHEHVPQEILQRLVEAGVEVHPGPEALRHAQDKLVMRKRLSDMGIPVPAWAAVSSLEEVSAFADEHGWPVVLKTPTGGYDGKGVLVASSPDEAREWVERGGGLLIEEAVPFVRELAVLVARSPSGQAAVWPVVETVQTDGICTEVLAPAPDLPEELATALVERALRIAGELGVTGVMAVEVFQTRDGGYLVNELAMRPHNSGHWTMDGSVTSQFEQHLRAVLDLPLGDTRARNRWTVMGNVLGGQYRELYPAYRHLMARDPGLKVHLYGKGVRPGRKIGHVNVFGDDLDALRERARHAADYLQGTVTE
ncbi:5-(carboxyamino)imidazole ribonucleotide synthase [Calidifontibacter sp. DB0510]|uniref:N5-carboxyaminoimidazole ribonucleotide synthase n=1 Tax=Metallococcus carri TaxID=1656884 RepID=A0A967AY72_9MICO|nr:5-(carboxyamino)imidazole ribonucleotide synthase [Metallococcus carri]NHN54622.1 5-(carboxyamino)imidazole ribonucleotide synthase [Metallococcus carri]NOP36539.1 5-(carboxyamino)imidazole ribonucleotide synthase [Calidifontibacter sp. DB2511S]